VIAVDVIALMDALRIEKAIVAGRVPELDELDLGRAGVKREKRGVIVNQYLQSVSHSAVYAGGDAAASGPALTPKADHDVGVLVTAASYNTRRVGETASGFKVLIEEGTGRILGAHLLGPNAAMV
jgi:glutathione reductase (NADPH)